MKFLVPFDFSHVSKNAVENALELAKLSGGEVMLLHITKDRDIVHRNELLLREYIHSIPDKGDVTFSESVVVGDVFEDLGKLAETHRAYCIIMGTHGVDFKQKIFGSNTVKIISHCSRPFVIMQDFVKLKKVKKIVVPFSIEKKSLQILTFVTHFCKAFDTEIHLLGRHHDDQLLKHQENAAIIMSKKHLLDHGVKHVFDISHTSKGDFFEYIIDYAAGIEADMIACTYYTDSIMLMFDKFVQNLIVNDKHIPVLCMNSHSVAKVDSILSVMTN